MGLSSCASDFISGINLGAFFDFLKELKLTLTDVSLQVVINITL